MANRAAFSQLSVAFVICLGLVAPAWGLPFTVTIDIQPNSGQVEAGAIASTGTPAAGTNGFNLTTQNLTTPGGDPFTLAISNNNASGGTTGGIDWRDRGNAAATSLLQLAEDFVKNNSGIIRVTLGSVPAGWYQVTSYHVDTENRQCEEIRVLVNDAVLSAYRDTYAYGEALYFGGRPAATGGGFATLTTALVQNSSAQFYVQSNGTNPIYILFDGTGKRDLETPLNGLTIVPSAAPTPNPPLSAPAVVNFDGAGGLAYRPTISAADTGTEAFWGRNSQKPAGVAVPTVFSGTTGDYWLGQNVADDDVAGGTGSPNQIAYFKLYGINFTNALGSQFVISLGAATGVWENSSDFVANNDYLVIEMDTNRDGTYETLIDRFTYPQTAGSGNLQSVLATSPYFGTQLTPSLLSLAYGIPGADGLEVNLRLRYRSNAADETIAFDDIVMSAANLVPEPGSLGILAVGLLSLARIRRRRRA